MGISYEQNQSLSDTGYTDDRISDVIRTTNRGRKVGYKIEAVKLAILKSNIIESKHKYPAEDIVGVLKHSYNNHKDVKENISSISQCITHMRDIVETTPLSLKNISNIVARSGQRLKENSENLAEFAAPGDVGPDGQPDPSPLQKMIDAGMKPQNIAYMLNRAPSYLAEGIQILTDFMAPLPGREGQSARDILTHGNDLLNYRDPEGRIMSPQECFRRIDTFTTRLSSTSNPENDLSISMAFIVGLADPDALINITGIPNIEEPTMDVLLPPVRTPQTHIGALPHVVTSGEVIPNKQPGPLPLQNLIDAGLSPENIYTILNGATPHFEEGIRLLTDFVAPLPGREGQSARDILTNGNDLMNYRECEGRIMSPQECFRRIDIFTTILSGTSTPENDLSISMAFMAGLADPGALINNAGIPNIEEEALNPEAPSIAVVFPPITSQTHIEVLPYVIAPAEVEEQPTPQPLQDADAIDANIGGMNGPGALLHSSFFKALEKLALNPAAQNIDVQLMPESIPHTVSKAISGFNEIGQILTDFLDPSPDRERQVACNILAEGDNPITSVSYNYFWEAAQPEVHTHVLLPSVIPPQTQAEPSHIRQQTVGGTGTKRARVEDYPDSFVGRLRKESLANIYSDPSNNDIPRR